jgi:hypothetical protein
MPFCATRLLVGSSVCVAVSLGSGCPSSNSTNDDDGGTAIDPNTPPITQGAWYRPSVDTTWQWQLQPDGSGAINTGYAVGLYDIDLFDVSTAIIDQLHRDGRRVIAYFSAGTFEEFRADSGEFSAEDLGEPLEDFADERWLDIRSDNVRRIVLARLDLAAAKGFDGVEPDNVDGFANDSGFDMTAGDQLAFNRFVANAAHERGLSVGLKNDLDQISQLVAYFDFAVNEQCHQFDECDALQPFIDAGKPVFNAEYQSRFVTSAAARDALCADATARSFRTLILPLDLDDSFRFSCDP